MTFWAYMLHCRGGVFYTGHTDDIDRRIAQHETGYFPGFTSELRPVHLVWSEEFPTRDEAKAAEKRIKGWSRKKKLALIRGDWAEISRLAKGKSGPSTSSGQTDFVVRRETLERMQSEARSAYPKECCGLLLGHPGLIEEARPAFNVAADPLRHFEIDPQSLVDAHRAARTGGPQVLGYYHSHPAGPARPSDTDRAQAAHDGRISAIVGAEGVTFWRDGEAGFVSLSYTITDR